MTRLPAGTPARPLSQPGMICSGVASSSNPNGCCRDHDESKTFLVRQLTPTYWVTTSSPLATGAPVPLIRVLVISFAGSLAAGIVTVGIVPGVALTEGSGPPPSETCWPAADAVAAKFLIRSTTNTTVSDGPTPIWALPWLP